MHQASCLCGSVVMQIGEVIGPYILCHCKSCRRASGSAFGAHISVPLEAFHITAGQQDIATYESSPGKVRHFCSKCGSPLYAVVGSAPGVVRVRLGVLDSEFHDPPSGHMFTGHKAAWEVIEGSLPQ